MIFFKVKDRPKSKIIEIYQVAS